MRENEPQLSDTTDPAPKPTGTEVKIVPTPETANLASELGDLEVALAGDHNISVQVLQDVSKALGNMTVDFFGDRLTMEQIRALPFTKEQTEILREIENGNMNGRRVNKLTYLPVRIAEHLMNHGGMLELHNLTNLNDAAAKHLGELQGDLYMSGLTHISDTTAKYLSKHEEGLLDLSGLTTLSDKAAGHLSKHKGPLFFEELTTISDKAAKHLGKHRALLDLSGLTTLTDKAAAYLSNHYGELHLSSLTSLTDTAAEHLSKHTSALKLESITSLTDAAAKHLSKHKAWIVLPGLTTISKKGLQYLRANATISLPADLKPTPWPKTPDNSATPKAPPREKQKKD